MVVTHGFAYSTALQTCIVKYLRASLTVTETNLDWPASRGMGKEGNTTKRLRKEPNSSLFSPVALSILYPPFHSFSDISCSEVFYTERENVHSDDGTFTLASSRNEIRGTSMRISRNATFPENVM
jgi:hypothetical protein